MKRSGLPKYVTWFVDRHGKRRVRARRRGHTCYFRSMPGTEAFLIEYQRWLAGDPPNPEVGERRTIPGSLSALIARYYRSAAWVVLAPQRRQRIAAFWNAYGPHMGTRAGTAFGGSTSAG